MGWRVPIDTSIIFQPIRIAVLTVSDTRTRETDSSGDILVQRLSDLGHELADRALVPDDKGAIVTQLFHWINDQTIPCVLITGGTGVTGRDVTPEALETFHGKEIPGFGELFRWVSYQTIGTSTIQSRAVAHVIRSTYVFAIPGSNGACRDAWDNILADQLDNRNKPCNFIELIGRLREV